MIFAYAHTKMVYSITVLLFTAGIACILLWLNSLRFPYEIFIVPKDYTEGKFGDSEIEFAILPRNPTCQGPKSRFGFGPKKPTLRPVGIFVFVLPQNFENRSAVRRTWGRTAVREPKFNVTFVIGLARNYQEERLVEAESLAYGDLLQIYMVESYKNLAWKTYGILKYAAQNCDKESLILKMDIDVFITMHGLDHIREVMGQQSRTIIGRTHNDLAPIRDPTNKWSITEQIYPRDLYPVYAQGPCYAMTGDVPELLIRGARKYGTYVSIEDAMFTGIAAENQNIHFWNASGEFDLWHYADHCNDSVVVMGIMWTWSVDQAFAENMETRRKRNCTLL